MEARGGAGQISSVFLTAPYIAFLRIFFQQSISVYTKKIILFERRETEVNFRSLAPLIRYCYLAPSSVPVNCRDHWKLSMNVLVLRMGFLIEKFGIFKARGLLTIVVTLGLVCFLFTPQVNWLVFPAVFLYSCGNYSFVLTNSMMSVLFPKIGALVLVIGQGLFQAGSSYFR